MLPAMHQAWAETTGALWSSRTMMVNPLSSVVSFTPPGIGRISLLSDLNGSLEFINSVLLATLSKGHTFGLLGEAKMRLRFQLRNQVPDRRNMAELLALH